MKLKHVINILMASLLTTAFIVGVMMAAHGYWVAFPIISATMLVGVIMWRMREKPVWKTIIFTNSDSYDVVNWNSYNSVLKCNALTSDHVIICDGALTQAQVQAHLDRFHEYEVDAYEASLDYLE